MRSPALRVASRFLFQRRSPNGLSGWLSYALGHTEYTDATTGETFDGDFDQRHTVNLYGHYRFSSKSSVSFKYRFGSNFPVGGYYVERDGLYFLSAERNPSRLPTYSRLDLRGNRTFLLRRSRITLFVEVVNVLGQDNYGPSGPSVNERSLLARDVTEKLFPSLPSAGIVWEF